MTNLKKLISPLLLLALSGCATLPAGPSVTVLPAPGKPFDTFRTEDATCRQWAEQHLGGGGAQQAYDNSVATGAVAGTAIGAGLGAALGSASGHAGAGAAIGAASGLLFGSAAGSESGRVYGMEAQRRYDNAYVQCMYSYGNQVPGYRTRVVAAAPAPVAVAPPPPPPVAAPVAEQIAPPPEMYLEEAPQFIYSPELNTYVAVGVPYDLIYTGTDYYYFYNGYWFRGPYYNGPWVPVYRRSYPPFLLSFRIGDIRHYRDIEFRRYDRDRGHYGGRFHRPEYRGERRRLERR